MTSILILIALQGIVALVMVAVLVLPERLRMEKRARRLLRTHPNAERKSVYLSFPGVRGKRAVMEARIAEIEEGGWTFLRATEANPLRTLRSWGGGLTLHFLRRSHPNGRGAIGWAIPPHGDDGGSPPVSISR